jgi:O-acetyl-ADP-ribose deacetylase
VEIKIVEGDLLDQPVEAIVNAWNQNFIPWWLLLPHGVSGAIKKRGGLQPFWEVGKFGPLKLGRAVSTSAGKLPFKAIIHVAGINVLWTATQRSITDSTVNAVKLADELQLKSLAFPVIGAGAGGFSAEKAEELMMTALRNLQSSVEVTIVRFRPR